VCTVQEVGAGKAAMISEVVARVSSITRAVSYGYQVSNYGLISSGLKNHVTGCLSCFLDLQLRVLLQVMLSSCQACVIAF
jgi:hypothetical protein